MYPAVLHPRPCPVAPHQTMAASPHPGVVPDVARRRPVGSRRMAGPSAVAPGAGWHTGCVDPPDPGHPLLPHPRQTLTFGWSSNEDTELSGPSRAHLSLQLLYLVLELPDVLRRVRVVQLALDAALLPLWVSRLQGVRKHPGLEHGLSHPTPPHGLTWISSSAMRCRISATAAMLSASRRRTAITSSLL